MIRLAVHGANGRMGQRVCALASNDARFASVVEMTRATTTNDGPISCDLIIDFSSPSGTQEAARIAVESGAALLVGTTGLTAENRRQLDDAADSVPVMVAPNTAMGVVVLNHLVKEATRLLGADFDPSLSETHHSAKRDAPSGTALGLAAAIRAAGGSEIAPHEITATRTGDVVGEHIISFEGMEERVEIRHFAKSRDVFARGALAAAVWLSGRDPGRYAIETTFGLTP